MFNHKFLKIINLVFGFETLNFSDYRATLVEFLALSLLRTQSQTIFQHTSLVLLRWKVRFVWVLHSCCCCCYRPNNEGKEKSRWTFHANLRLAVVSAISRWRCTDRFRNGKFKIHTTHRWTERGARSSSVEHATLLLLLLLHLAFVAKREQTLLMHVHRGSSVCPEHD